MTSIKSSPELVQSMKSYLQLTSEDEQLLVNLQEPAAKYLDSFVEEFYDVLLSWPETKAYFSAPGAIDRAKTGQRRYFLSLFAGKYDENYFDQRVSVGRSHDSMGVLPCYYCAAYSFYLCYMLPHFMNVPAENSQKRVKVMQALIKLLLLDLSLAWEAFYTEREERLQKEKEELERRRLELEGVYNITAKVLNERSDQLYQLQKMKKELRDFAQKGESLFDKLREKMLLTSLDPETAGILRALREELDHALNVLTTT